MALRQLSTTEQRLRAVLAVEAGGRVGEVAFASGVSRQSLHAWLVRYRGGGLEGLADRSHRPDTCQHQASPAVEAAVCEMRRDHPLGSGARYQYIRNPGVMLVEEIHTFTGSHADELQMLVTYARLQIGCAAHGVEIPRPGTQATADVGG